MAHEDFSRSFAVPASALSTWATMTDVEQLISWISVLEDASTVEPLDRYRAVLQDRLGMFALRADLEILVTEHTEPTFIVATAEGEDRQVGSRIRVDVRLELDERQDGGETHLTVSGRYEVTGRVATLGSSTIRRKADKILEEFFTNLGTVLT